MRRSIIKLFIIVVILLFAIIYASPNLYQNTLSIYVSCKEKKDMFDKHMLKIFSVLQHEKIKYTSFQKHEKDVILFFDEKFEQLKAYEKLKKIFSKNKNTVFFDLRSYYPSIFKIFHAKPANLGLDLKGGTHLLLKVNFNHVLQMYQKNAIKYFSDYSFKHNYKDFRIKKISNYGVQFNSEKYFLLDQIQREINLNYSNFLYNRKSNNTLCVHFTKKYIKSIMQLSIDKNIYILKNRIHQLGFGEPIVQQQNFDSIIIELPGFGNNMKVKEILSANTMIEFHLVNNNYDNIFNLKKSKNFPKNSKLYWVDANSPILLYKSAFITGEHIIDSNYLTNDLNQIEVNVTLNRVGGNIMSNVTQKNIGEYIAILFLEYIDSNTQSHNKYNNLKLKESILNIAKIDSILDNSFRIIGIKDISEAKKLSILLKTGSFSSPVKIIEETVIGPSIGKNNIKNGMLSCIISILLCILMMIIRYKRFGIIASIALISNLLLIIAIISVLPGIVLTMPGISSILLMLAFSIDSNVLINERIKEEINNNVYIREAVNKGYIRAYRSIFDANVTMLIISIVLYIIGTDIIKNFAIITIIGIFTSLFSALFITYTIIQVFYHKKNIHKLFM
ncbi:MAG: protein translocase subunit SecD [Buchnera aphidicola (Nurudea yanoniella)]